MDSKPAWPQTEELFCQRLGNELMVGAIGFEPTTPTMSR